MPWFTVNKSTNQPTNQLILAASASKKNTIIETSARLSKKKEDIMVVQILMNISFLGFGAQKTIDLLCSFLFVENLKNKRLQNPRNVFSCEH